MVDLQKLTEQAVQNLHTSGKIQEIIEKQLEATIKSAISDALRDYSDFGKELSATLKTQLKVDPSAVALSQYNLVVSKILKAKLDQHLMKEGIEKFEKLVSDLTLTAPTEIKLSDLLNKLIEENEDEARTEEWRHPTILIERSDSRFIHIYLDAKPDTRKYECKYQIAMCEGEAPYSVELKDWASDNQFSKTLFVKSFDGVDRMMFWFFTKSTKLILDVKESSISYDFEYPGDY